MSELLEKYLNFEFSNNDGDVLVDALGDNSVQLGYWSIIIFCWKILDL